MVFSQRQHITTQNLLSRRAIMKARRRIIEYLKRLRAVATDQEALRCPAAHETPVRLLDKVDLQAEPHVLGVLEDDTLYHVYKALYQAATSGERHGEGEGEGAYPGTRTIGYKWLRAVGTGLFTGVHSDRVYMGASAPSMVTAWIPVGDVAVNQGTLLVLRGSNTAPEFARVRATYGSTRVGPDGVASGWLCQDPNDITTQLYPDIPPNAVQWVTSDMHAGDVILLAMDTIHCSTTNTTQQLRISCDTRWYVASETAAFAPSTKIVH